jgi:hypothetical protein
MGFSCAESCGKPVLLCGKGQGRVDQMLKKSAKRLLIMKIS